MGKSRTTTRPTDQTARNSAFKRTISQLLNTFLQEPNEKGIHKGLSEVLSFYEADIVTLRIFKPDSDDMYDFIVEKKGAEDTVNLIHELITDKEHDAHHEFIHLITQIKEGTEIVIDDTDYIPEEFSYIKKIVTSLGMKSSLILPTYNNSHAVNGYIVIDFVTRSHTWNADDIEDLRVISGIFSNTIDHIKANRIIEVTTLNSLRNDILLERMFQKLPVGLEIYDENGYLMRINKEDLNILGTTEEEIIGINLFDNPTIPAEAKEKIKRGEEFDIICDNPLEQILASKYFESTHAGKIKRLLGKCVPLKDKQENIFGYIALIIDNTAHYEREKQLEYNLTKLQMAMDTDHAITWEYDVKSNRISSEKALQGGTSSWNFIPPAQADMQSHLQLIHPEDVDRVYNEAILPVLNGESKQIIITYRQYMNGKLEWLTTNFHGYYNENETKPGKVFCYTMIMTKQYDMKLELVRMKETERLKVQFMENLSHEIRTPLNTIIGFSNHIVETNPTDENKEMIDLINENNEILLNVVDNLINMSKIETGGMDDDFTRFDLKKVCSDLYHSFCKKTPDGIELRFNPSLPSVFLHSNEKSVRLAISMLLDNALKFTEKGTVSLFYEVIDDAIVVSVADTGIGITEEEQKQIYLPFYKANSFTKGTGLGLPISKKLINNLGGELDVTSQKEKGSTFRLTLPVNREKKLPEV